MKEEEKEAVCLDSEKQTRYRSGVGMLLYLVKFSRPDIYNSVRELTKSMRSATESHYQSLIIVLKFVMETQDFGLIYDSGILINFKGIWKIIAYSDSYFGGDTYNRISLTVFCIYIGNCLIAWKSRGQKSVTLSSTEAEYIIRK